MSRKASFHDYKSRCYYMFTAIKQPGIPLFSSLVLDPDSSIHSESREDLGNIRVLTHLFPIGEIIFEEFKKTNEMRYADFEITEKVIMPDHVHFIVFVKRRLEVDITDLLAKTFSSITSRCRRAKLIGGNESVFEAHPTHGIVRGRGRLKRMEEYIHDNPRRLYLKRLHPDYFRHFGPVELFGENYILVGNKELLKERKIPVHVRSAWNAGEREKYNEECKEAIESGAVVVSPFISEYEKEIERMAKDGGGSLIKIRHEGIAEREAPGGEEFDLCAQGRILLIYPAEAARKIRLSRQICRRMNALAEQLSRPGL